MVATVIAKPAQHLTQAMLDDCYRTAYAGADCVSVRDTPPATRDVRGSARAHVHVRLDEQRQTVTAICVIDNLPKGHLAKRCRISMYLGGYPRQKGCPYGHRRCDDG